jgi:hypothetical protein
MENICSGKEMYYLSFSGSFDYPAQVHETIDFGDVIANTASTIRIIVNGGFDVRNFNLGRILTVDNTVVFVGSK